VPPPPERVGVNVVVLIAATFRVVGTARNTDFPAKKDMFKFPDARVGVIAAENGGGVAPVLYAICASPPKLLPPGANTSRMALPADAGAVLR
jgi:hypothetical protein